MLGVQLCENCEIFTTSPKWSFGQSHQSFMGSLVASLSTGAESILWGEKKFRPHLQAQFVVIYRRLPGKSKPIELDNLSLSTIIAQPHVVFLRFSSVLVRGRGEATDLVKPYRYT